MTVRTIDQLELEFNPDFDPNAGQLAGGLILMTPAVGDPSLAAFRVRLTDLQSLVGFPKFGTIGIGFEEEEEDWNTNLPYSVDPSRLADHISHNRLVYGSDDEDPQAEEIPRALVIAAIKMIREAAALLPAYGKICGRCHGARAEAWRAGPPDAPFDRLPDDHWEEECAVHGPGYLDKDDYSEPGQRDADGWPIKNYDDDDEE